MIRKALLVALTATALVGCDNAKPEQSAAASTNPGDTANTTVQTGSNAADTGTQTGGGSAAPVSMGSPTASVAPASTTAASSPAASGANTMPAAGTSLSTEGKVTTASGLKYTILSPGKADAKVAKVGDTAVVHYTGWLPNGKKFDSSLDRGQPFDFKLGEHRVIGGWEEGVAGMKVGEKRKLVIPPKLGYGESGMGDIPANSTLIFEVQLLDLK